jgi:hypothetical protein
MTKASSKGLAAAYDGARHGAIIGALMALFALAISTLLLALSPEFQRERPDLTVAALSVTYLGGGTIAGAVAGALRVFWTGRLGKMAIGVLLTAIGYVCTYSLIHQEPFILDGEHLFGLLFTSIPVGALLGLSSIGNNTTD